ncbi:Run And Fyve Domain-Containing Protein 1 [Manis pentadactyla]|nr:Run And Fyve Domain-Containing Protein 1 [Manis pentadactyla]
MAETSPLPPTAGAESCSEEQARGGEQRPEDEAGPPLASPAEQSEPGSPVAAPFFLLYPGDGGAGFAARPPPQQRTWRTPPSPGSPLPFLLLSYPSSSGGGGGCSKHL